MTRPLALATALLCTALPAMAEDIVLDHSAEFCAAEYSDGRVTLSDKVISFYESACDITAETATPTGGRDLTLACYGEGEEWTLALQVDQTGTGYRLTTESGSVDYVRCN
jgi:hypothetical protein